MQRHSMLGSFWSGEAVHLTRMVYPSFPLVNFPAIIFQLKNCMLCIQSWLTDNVGYLCSIWRPSAISGHTSEILNKSFLYIFMENTIDWFSSVSLTRMSHQKEAFC